MTVVNITRLFLLLLLSIVPSLLAANEKTRPVADGRRLKERATKGAKNKKSKDDKSGKNGQNIFNVDHRGDACATHKKEKKCRKHPECQWTESHGCVKVSTPGQNPPQPPGAIPTQEPGIFLGSGTSCEKCSIEPKDLFDKSKCPSACWQPGLDFLPDYCGCKCTNPETCDSSNLCCPGYECQMGKCVDEYTYGKDVCWKIDNDDEAFQSCFVNPDDDCVGDLGYGCRPANSNWLTVKFVQNPGYEPGPRECGAKCQEVVPI